MTSNPPFVPQPRRSAEQTQISISLPRDLLSRIDTAAAAEKRNRSNFITTQLERALDMEAPEPSAEGDGEKPKKKKKKKA